MYEKIRTSNLIATENEISPNNSISIQEEFDRLYNFKIYYP
jgi:hypothetical protein